jgi:hypothetical protein
VCVVAAAAAIASFRYGERQLATSALHERVDRLAAHLARQPALCALTGPPGSAPDVGAFAGFAAFGSAAGDRRDGGALLASWTSVGGCGAGASVGTGGGVKWIGRNVRGGMFHLEFQANYIKMPYGYNFVGTSLVSHDLTERWNLGVSVPYLYKWMSNPYDVGVDLANKGPGDINVLITRRFGAIQNWNLTLSLGAPTGAHKAMFRTERLPQDRQLGLGKPTASIVLDHSIDYDWGPVVVGGSAGWRGGTNEFRSYRAPSGSLYAYAAYLLGPFAPAIGLSATSFAGLDLDLGEEQALPFVSLSANASLEWSPTDSMAILLGASLPYDWGVHSESVVTYNRLGAWTLSLGAAFAMF